MVPFGATGPTAPEVLTRGAELHQIAAAINRNTARVHSVSAPNSTITIPGSSLVPSLRGRIALERPMRFRLTAGTGLTGQEVDLGSNDERFWLWVRRNQPAAVYVCRHDQFAGSGASQVMPIEPRWLHSAMGLVELDPASVYQGPTPRRDGTLELRSYLPSSAGTLHRVLVVDASRAWVLEQHVYDASGTTLIASAVAHSHRYYPQEQVSLPDRLTIRLPTAQIAMNLDVGQVQLNGLAPDGGQLWTMPPFVGYPQTDLGTTPATMAPPFGGFTGRTSPPPVADASVNSGAAGQLSAQRIAPRTRPRGGLFGRNRTWGDRTILGRLRPGTVQPASHEAGR